MQTEPTMMTPSVRLSSAVERIAMPDEEPQDRKRPRRSAESTPSSESGHDTVERVGGRDLRTPYGCLEPSVLGSPCRDSLLGLFPKKLSLGFDAMAEANGEAKSARERSVVSLPPRVSRAGETPPGPPRVSRL